MDSLIGLLLVVSFGGMVFYCIKGYNLMIGFIVMATLWVLLPLIGNVISPNPAFENLLLPRCWHRSINRRQNAGGLHK